MAVDPFEGRLMFLQLLQRLNATVRSQQTAALFAIKNPDLEEDLYSCILEELEGADTNMRANIFFFIETLCDLASRTPEVHYVQMISRDIKTIVDLVVAKSRANTASAARVLDSLRDAGHISSAEAQEVHALLAQRVQDPEENSESKKALSTEEILRRMEEDRERQKILRENIWAIPQPTPEIPNPEFQNDFEIAEPWTDTDRRSADREAARVEAMWLIS